MEFASYQYLHLACLGTFKIPLLPFKLCTNFYIIYIIFMSSNGLKWFCVSGNTAAVCAHWRCGVESHLKQKIFFHKFFKAYYNSESDKH